MKTKNQSSSVTQTPSVVSASPATVVSRFTLGLDLVDSSHHVCVPQREAMELMRHNDPRLTANTYADSSLFALRGAVEKLAWTGDSQRDSQKVAQWVFGRHWL